MISIRSFYKFFFWGLIATCWVGLFCANSVLAGTYYVSPSGTASWSNCTTQNQPCRASTAMANASAGDTVIFLDGTYSGLTYNNSNYDVPSLNPSNSGTSSSPITFKAQNQYQAVLIGYNDQGTKRVPLIGANGRNYIIWDGFTLKAVDTNNDPVMASAYFYNSDYSTVRNCDIQGAAHSTGGALNYEGVRVEASSHVLVEKNRIHGFIETSNNHNTSGTKQYYTKNITFRNNEIFDNTAGIYIKRDNDDTVIENNYIHDNYLGEYASGNAVSSHGISHTNNVYANSYVNIEIVGDSSSVDMDGLVFINNTFVGTSTSISINGASNTRDPAILYNNIFYNSSTTIRTVYDYTKIKESDHNNHGNFNNIKLHDYGSNSTSYSSLTSWQASNILSTGKSPGSGSIASNPLFTNGSGSYSKLDDFKLSSSSPCISAGRNGENMGADIETVGTLATVEPPSGTTISTPSGFTITNQ